MKYISLILSIILIFFAIVCGVGYMEILLGIIPTEIPIVLEGTLDYFDYKWQLIGQDSIPFIFVICIVSASILLSHYHRLKNRKKDTFDVQSIKEPFVLYLRSFCEDKTTRKQVSFNDVRSEEEVFVEVLSDIAPVYAIGDPKDKKMPVGASRIYVDDEHWKDTVKEMAEKSVAVVLRLGKTDSFWWEVEMVLKNIPLNKLVFIIPESKTFTSVAYLYKLLLDHKIDIKAPEISIEQKSSGSISSFLFFDNDGKPVTTEVKTPRFTRLFMSYENIIRNALDQFRVKFGLSPAHKRSVAKARLLLFLLVFYVLFVAGAKIFNDLMSLKYQMPYDFVEKCVNNTGFVHKYSDEINGNNLIYGIVEAKKGAFALDDIAYMTMTKIELLALKRMKKDEFEQLGTYPKAVLLMVKKYVPEHYDLYTDILSEAASLSISSPDEIEELIESYKSKTDSLPDWLINALYSDKEYDSTYEYEMNYLNEVVNHIDDPDIAEISKIMQANAFSN